MEIRHVEGRDVKGVMELIRHAFGRELGVWGADPASGEKLLRFLLAARSLPLRGVRLLGLRFKLWVAVEGGEVVGTLAQFGGAIPSLSGIAVSPGYRRRGVAKALLNHAFSDLKKEGARLVVGSVRKENGAALGLCRSVGMEPFDEAVVYSVPLPPRALPPIPQGLSIRHGKRKDIATLSPRISADLRMRTRLNAAASPGPLRLLGVSRKLLVVEEKGVPVGFAALQMGRFWRGATLNAPVLGRGSEGAFLSLLRGAVSRSMARGRETLRVVLPEELRELDRVVRGMGGEPIGAWVQLVRYLRPEPWER